MVNLKILLFYYNSVIQFAKLEIYNIYLNSKKFLNFLMSKKVFFFLKLLQKKKSLIIKIFYKKTIKFKKLIVLQNILIK